MKAHILLLTTVAAIVGQAALGASLQSTTSTTTYYRVAVEGVSVFYWEAGPTKDAPILSLKSPRRAISLCKAMAAVL